MRRLYESLRSSASRPKVIPHPTKGGSTSTWSRKNLTESLTLRQLALFLSEADRRYCGYGNDLDLSRRGAVGKRCSRLLPGLSSGPSIRRRDTLCMTGGPSLSFRRPPKRSRRLAWRSLALDRLKHLLSVPEDLMKPLPTYLLEPLPVNSLRSFGDRAVRVSTLTAQSANVSVSTLGAIAGRGILAN